ncbi:hypothetical protein BGX21_004609 [Mortierella sp. AD011]|nr:hypothetical protein BGX20_007283 [Mortierella sp. AD010]KAF9400287.1 hypothetical protein BGX21_004609 [Mortierella sp. AD011]
MNPSNQYSYSLPTADLPTDSMPTESDSLNCLPQQSETSQDTPTDDAFARFLLSQHYQQQDSPQPDSIATVAQQYVLHPAVENNGCIMSNSQNLYIPTSLPLLFSNTTYETQCSFTRDAEYYDSQSLQQPGLSNFNQMSSIYNNFDFSYSFDSETIPSSDSDEWSMSYEQSLNLWSEAALEGTPLPLPPPQQQQQSKVLCDFLTGTVGLTHHTYEPNPQRVERSPPVESSEEEEPFVADGRRANRRTRRQPKSGKKRTRKALSLHKKLDIILYHRQNPSVSIAAIARIKNVPRTTIHGIIRDQEEIIKKSTDPCLEHRMTDTYRIVKRPFRILESLLQRWIRDLNSRGISLSDLKITTQAFEIYRMLNYALSYPLIPYKFTSVWLRKFKEQNRYYLEAPRCDTSGVDSCSLEELLQEIKSYPSNDTFLCGKTSMFLSVHERLLEPEGKGHAAGGAKRASVSILFCLNAGDMHSPRPLVHVRHSTRIVVSNCYDGLTIDPDHEDLTGPGFHEWLREFDCTLGRKVLFLVNEPLWELYKSSTSSLQHIKVLKVPTKYNILYPITTNTIKAFKANYLRLLARLWSFAEASAHMPLITLIELKLGFVLSAWRETKDKINLQQLFKEMIYGDRNSESGSLTYEKSVEKELISAFKLTFHISDESQLKYQCSQDEDTGPTASLLNHLREIKRSPEYSEWFRSAYTPEREPLFCLKRLAVQRSDVEACQRMQLVFLSVGSLLEFTQEQLESYAGCSPLAACGSGYEVVIYNNDQQPHELAHPMAIKKEVHIELPRSDL